MKSTKKEIKSSINVGRRFQGRKELLDYGAGKSLSPLGAIRAYCYGCMGEYADGPGDCGNPECPLHPFMPYNVNKAKRRRVSKDLKEKMKAGRKND